MALLRERATMEVFEGKVKNKSGKEVTIKVIDEGGILNYQEEVEFVVINFSVYFSVLGIGSYQGN